MVKAENERKDEMYRLSRQLSHDIRSPLSALNAIAARVSENDPDAGKILGDISGRISNISNSVIKNFYEDIYARKTQHLTKLVDLINSIKTEKDLSWQSREKKIQIFFEYSSHFLSLEVEFDRTELSRIISNILENSYEALDPNGRIKIEIKNSPKNPSEILCSIHDNGKGIPPEIMKQIGSYGFSYGKENGAGIALSHAKRIVEMFKGNLTIESEYGKFTCISLLLKPAAAS